MTEQEWLASGDSRTMLEFLLLQGKLSDRKLRLWVCACCRQAWDRLPQRCRRAVQIAERFAEGQATLEQLQRGRELAEEHIFAGRTDADYGARDVVRVACYASSSLPDHAGVWADFDLAVSPAVQAGLLRCVFGNPFRPLTRYEPCKECSGTGHLTQQVYAGDGEWKPIKQHCKKCLGSGRKDLWSPWLTWNNGTVPRLAQAIYAERAFERMPMLADALEEAGCRDEDILQHCRHGDSHLHGCWVCERHGYGAACPHCVKGIYATSMKGQELRCDACAGTGKILPPGPHARGCWVLDLLLGKE